MHYGSGDHTYDLVEDWATLPDGESFVDVCRICVADGEVLVLNRGDRPVMTFDDAGERLSAWGDEHLSGRPHGMALGPDGTVHCTDDGDHTVRTFTRDGDLLSTLGTPGEASETGYRHAEDLFERLASIDRGAGPFNRPTGVTVLDTGERFVADGYGNARVHAFGPDGDLRDSWGGPGPDPGEFRLPHAITADEAGRLWVTDRENSRVQVFDADGRFREAWTDLIRPTDVAVTDEAVYVAELCNRVSVFSREGDCLARWGNADHPGDDRLFVAPHAVAVDARGDVYVGEVARSHAGLDRGVRAVRKFARVG